MNDQHIILFYKYHPLSESEEEVEIYRSSLEKLCQALNLCGRILVGCSKTEGINGTLAGSYEKVLAFTFALLRKYDSKDTMDSCNGAAVEEFWRESSRFFETIGEEPLAMSSPEDFKWSTDRSSEPLFPDLNVKLVKELIGTGGVLAHIPLEQTANGYLTPEEWHDELDNHHGNDETILIDCRNTKEHQIGHFEGSIDPGTTAFSQFPQWVHHNKHLLANKKVRMFCTGGIRCEKASAFIRNEVPSVQEVKHLRGGIHKYVEKYGSEGHWKGKNFVFDVRCATAAKESQLVDGEPRSVENIGVKEVVGRCVDCDEPYDQFDPHCVCTVCREPTLVCNSCQARLREFHCTQHKHLKTCYFTDLKQYSQNELEAQLLELHAHYDEIAVGRRFRQKRKTLQKQMERLVDLTEKMLNSDKGGEGNNATRVCRNCRQVGCSGRCWGFYGLKRKELLSEAQSISRNEACKSRSTSSISSKVSLPNPKKIRRDQIVQEAHALGISKPSSIYRDEATGVRVPPCVTRVLQCSVKAKWCGEYLLRVVQQEFAELARPEVLSSVLAHGLLRINDCPVSATEAAKIQLKSSDRISRVVHWHEAPVLVPTHIPVKRKPIPDSIIDSWHIKGEDASIYVVNKPSSVPVHQAGPYFLNCITTMIEAQEGLSPMSLNPIHRTDRVTSGLTLLTTNRDVARLMHKSLSETNVKKLYVARVCGRFPASKLEAKDIEKTCVNFTCRWTMSDQILIVDAPVHTSDPANGVRTVSPEGKPSQTRFKLLAYDEVSNCSIVLCSPITGRNHQIRVHLQWLGKPIVGDTQYGGSDYSMLSPAQEARVVDLMFERNHSDEMGRLSRLSHETLTAAKKACSCCKRGRSGIHDSFNDTQLLKKGYAIQLHALRYGVQFSAENSRSARTVEVEPSVSVDFGVDLPEWASHIDQEELQWL